ncbi:MAG: hypothetical protein AAB508_00480 [Patescibacteria group bacterium]
MGQQTVTSTKESKKKRNIIAFILGLITFILLGILDSYIDKSQIISLLPILIICTAGVGGCILFGLMMFTGYAELIIYESFIKIINKSNSEIIPIFNPQLQQYISQAKKANLSKNQIIENLLHVGWSRKTVDQAIETNYLQKNNST